MPRPSLCALYGICPAARDAWQYKRGGVRENACVRACAHARVPAQQLCVSCGWDGGGGRDHSLCALYDGHLASFHEWLEMVLLGLNKFGSNWPREVVGLIEKR